MRQHGIEHVRLIGCHASTRPSSTISLLTGHHPTLTTALVTQATVDHTHITMPLPASHTVRELVSNTSSLWQSTPS